MLGQGHLPEDSQQFLRLRRGHGTDLPTAEQGWEWRSWMKQQSWEETQEQVPVLGCTGRARAGTSVPAPSHPVPGTSADLAKRKHKGREEGREASVEMPSPMLKTWVSSGNWRAKVWPMPAPFFSLRPLKTSGMLQLLPSGQAGCRLPSASPGSEMAF